ncbi:MAG: hypothetical protein LBB13_02225, partial [Rickettsiales bacterium]|nr:hypothetical protein [Rickettsiales bacterium]
KKREKLNAFSDVSAGVDNVKLGEIGKKENNTVLKQAQGTNSVKALRKKDIERSEIGLDKQVTSAGGESSEGEKKQEENTKEFSSARISKGPMTLKDFIVDEVSENSKIDDKEFGYLSKAGAVTLYERAKLSKKLKKAEKKFNEAAIKMEELKKEFNDTTIYVGENYSKNMASLVDKIGGDDTKSADGKNPKEKKEMRRDIKNFYDLVDSEIKKMVHSNTDEKKLSREEEIEKQMELRQNFIEGIKKDDNEKSDDKILQIKNLYNKHKNEIDGLEEKVRESDIKTKSTIDSLKEQKKIMEEVITQNAKEIVGAMTKNLGGNDLIRGDSGSLSDSDIEKSRTVEKKIRETLDRNKDAIEKNLTKKISASPLGEENSREVTEYSSDQLIEKYGKTSLRNFIAKKVSENSHISDSHGFNQLSPEGAAMLYDMNKEKGDESKRNLIFAGETRFVLALYNMDANLNKLRNNELYGSGKGINGECIDKKIDSCLEKNTKGNSNDASKEKKSEDIKAFYKLVNEEVKRIKQEEGNKERSYEENIERLVEIRKEAFENVKNGKFKTDSDEQKISAAEAKKIYEENKEDIKNIEEDIGKEDEKVKGAVKSIAEFKKEMDDVIDQYASVIIDDMNAQLKEAAIVKQISLEKEDKEQLTKAEEELSNEMSLTDEKKEQCYEIKKKLSNKLNLTDEKKEQFSETEKELSKSIDNNKENIKKSMKESLKSFNSNYVSELENPSVIPKSRGNGVQL